ACLFPPFCRRWACLSPPTSTTSSSCPYSSGATMSDQGATYRILIGQYLGLIGTLGAAVLAALSAQALLSERVLPYFGLIPIGLGLWAARQAWRNRGKEDDDAHKGSKRVSMWTVAVVTFANGGDNIGVFVPVFMTVSWDTILGYC